MSPAGSAVRGTFLATLALGLAACASRDLWPVERVDPDTAVHLTIMAEPWKYVLDDPRQPARASQFLDITVVETNQMGSRRYWLNAVAWSTGVPHERAGATAGDGLVKLLWDGTSGQEQFACAAAGRAAAGIREPVIAIQGARTGEAWCPLSLAQVRAFGNGAPSAVSTVDGEGRTRAYASWEVGNAAMAEFLKATGAGTH